MEVESRSVQDNTRDDSVHHEPEEAWVSPEILAIRSGKKVVIDMSVEKESVSD